MIYFCKTFYLLDDTVMKKVIPNTFLAFLLSQSQSILGIAEEAMTLRVEGL
jgi:hypothetical protein